MQLPLEKYERSHTHKDDWHLICGVSDWFNVSVSVCSISYMSKTNKRELPNICFSKDFFLWNVIKENEG